VCGLAGEWWWVSWAHAVPDDQPTDLAAQHVADHSIQPGKAQSSRPTVGSSSRCGPRPDDADAPPQACRSRNGSSPSRTGTPRPASTRSAIAIKSLRSVSTLRLSLTRRWALTCAGLNSMYLPVLLPDSGGRSPAGVRAGRHPTHRLDDLLLTPPSHHTRESRRNRYQRCLVEYDYWSAPRRTIQSGRAYAATRSSALQQVPHRCLSRASTSSCYPPAQSRWW
jgi:hypothetical protein